MMSGFWPAREKMPVGKTDDVMVVKCGDSSKPEGVEQGISPIDALVLARPYPRAFPSPATFHSDSKANTLQISGNAPNGNVPLIIWVPRKTKPKLQYENINEVSLEQVSGGWLVRGLPGAGVWNLSVLGGD